jgi:hypothetical protein
MTPQMIIIIILMAAFVAYWRVALLFLLGGTFLLLALGLAQLLQFLHMQST